MRRGGGRLGENAVEKETSDERRREDEEIKQGKMRGKEGEKRRR